MGKKEISLQVTGRNARDGELVRLSFHLENGTELLLELDLADLLRSLVVKGLGFLHGTERYRCLAFLHVGAPVHVRLGEKVPLRNAIIPPVFFRRGIADILLVLL